MSNKKSYPPPPSGKKYIFRPWRHNPRTGEIEYAWQFNCKAFPILVDE